MLDHYRFLTVAMIITNAAEALDDPTAFQSATSYLSATVSWATSHLQFAKFAFGYHLRGSFVIIASTPVTLPPQNVCTSAC
jgi:hypothetical protein